MGLLEGKAAVVTGSGKGLGRAYALALAKEGAAVVVNDIDVPSAEKTVAEIKASGGKAALSPDSVASWAGAERIIETCVKAFGRIDCLVNNAGIMLKGTLWELSEHDYEHTLSVHLKGTIGCSHFACRHMRQQHKGSIINISSRASSGHPNSSLYSVAKAGILGATYSWAQELAEYGIRVNAVFPDGMTPMVIDMQGPSAARNAGMHPTLANYHRSAAEARIEMQHPPPETVAPIVVFLATDDSSSINGQVLFLSGDTLALVSHPTPIRVAYKRDGWSVQDLREYLLESVGSALHPVGFGKPTYDWYDGVRPTS